MHAGSRTCRRISQKSWQIKFLMTSLRGWQPLIARWNRHCGAKQSCRTVEQCAFTSSTGAFVDISIVRIAKNNSLLSLLSSLVLFHSLPFLALFHCLHCLCLLSSALFTVFSCSFTLFHSRHSRHFLSSLSSALQLLALHLRPSTFFFSSLTLSHSLAFKLSYSLPLSSTHFTHSIPFSSIQNSLPLSSTRFARSLHQVHVRRRAVGHEVHGKRRVADRDGCSQTQAWCSPAFLSRFC
jgi:hypothetical protein